MVQPVRLSAALNNILPDARLQKTSLNTFRPITLWLIDPSGWDAVLTAQQASAAFNSPPYWCFCWGSGIAVSHWIGNNTRCIRGKTVVDFGSGSGVVAIAAKLAGAARVFACDIDPLARVAIEENSRLNSVTLEILENLSKLRHRVDYLFAADVLYDPENLTLAQHFTEHANQVVIADSRLKNFTLPGYVLVDRVTAVTKPDLGENEDVKQVRLYSTIQSERVSNPV